MEKQKDGISFWKNTKKVDGDTKPHFTGKGFIKGTAVRGSIWITSQDHLQENPKRPRMRLSVMTEADFQEKFQQQHDKGMQEVRNTLADTFQPSQPAPIGTHITADEFDDDIPF